MSKEAMIVHRSRLYVPEVYTVNCLAYDAVQRKLSVGRRVADASDTSYPNVIEIWNAAESPNLFRELTIPFRDCSLEAMVWCQKRLFCAASDGSVTEYSAHRVTPLNSIQVCSSPIWCLAKNSKETLIAVGTDTGAIYLLSVLAGEAEWHVEKILAASFDFRILSLAWHPNDTILAGGSLDCIQTWDAESGRPLVRINMGRAERKKETIVWSLAITRDSVIVSGDSRGKVCFWNAKTGSLINSHELHQADVLAVALTKSAAFAAGVDPRMHAFATAQIGRKRSDSMRESAVLSSNQAALRPDAEGTTTAGEWRPTAMRSAHTHDVRAIVRIGDHLVSAGADSLLCLTPSYNFKSPNISIPPFDSAVCRLANKAGRALIQYSTHLDVWTLGKTAPGTTAPLRNSVLHTAENPSKLAELRTRKGALILSSAISANGQIVAFSDRLSTTVVRITEIDSAPTVYMAKTTTEERLASAVSLAVASTASFVLIATDDQRLIRVDVDGLVLSPVQLVDSFDVLGGIRKLQLSPDDKKVAGITTSYEILIFDVHSGQLLHTVKPPRAVPVDCAFFDNDRLAILYGAGSDFHLAEAVVSTRRFSEWNVPLREAFYSQARRGSGTRSPRSISVADEQVIVASDDKFVVVRRQSKRDSAAVMQSADGLSHVVSAEWMKQDGRGGELLLTQIDPTTYVRRLPPAMRLKRFGVN